MNFFKQNIEQYKKDLAKLISFKTVLDVEYPNQEMKDALAFMGELAERDGLEYKIDPEGYYGWVQIGKGDGLIGILTHIDVVPEGNADEWNTPPFEMTEMDGNLYGRGTQDDKGPLMLMYYLLLEYKDVIKGKRIRLIFPTDEESKWRGVAKYKENEEIPSFGFTPDSEFPVTFLEREIGQFELIGPGSHDYEVQAGTAANVVPAKATIRTVGLEKTFDGKSAHAMNPSAGENAIVKMVNELPEITHPMFNFIREQINGELNGETLFGRVIEDQYSAITVNLAILEINEEYSRIVIDSRIPLTSNKEELLNLYKLQGSKYKFKPSVFKSSPSVYMPENSWLVRDLIEAYQSVTGDMSPPKVAGGGTYAKAMDNVLAYGPLLPRSEFTMHQYNEYISLEDYEVAYDVYNKLFDKWLQYKSTK